jgi:hypothetical protein
MAHMKKEKEIRVYFQIKENYYQLFNTLYFVTEGLPEFKFSGFSDFVIINDEPTSLSPDGVMSEDDFAKSFFSRRSELTYHKDGSMLKKTPDNPSGKIYTNPHGKDVRWTPPCDIAEVQPIFYICIRRVNIYTPSSLEEKDNIVNYVCKNEELFNEDGTYYVLFFLKNKNINLARFTTPDSYSDIVYSGCKGIDMCISIIRHSYPKPQPYKSKYFGHAIITPYAMNSYNFCKKYDTPESFLGEEIVESMKRINQYMLTLVGTGFRRISKDEMLIIELSEKLYEEVFQRDTVSKALIVKAFLSVYANVELNINNIEGKKKTLHSFFNLFCAIPQYKEDILNIIESEKSDEQKVKDIIMIAS